MTKQGFWIVFAGIFRLVMLVSALFWLSPAVAITYTSASTTYSWIDSSAHAKLGYNTVPYKFNGTGCGTTPPTLDDTISDVIPIGFSFLFGTTNFTTLQIQSNGRIQFGNSMCGYGTQSSGPPQTYPYPYPNATLNNTMKVFQVDLDPTNRANIPNYPTSCNNYATCYVSYATLGTAPNRKLVITWNNIPEWLSANSTSGSFNLQVILNEDGTFIYQYGSIIHGGTGPAQIGWQLSTSDYAVSSFGASAEPPPNTAVLFYVPFSNALAEYRFEDGAWSSGGIGQVADVSGNGLPGTALGTAQVIAAGYVCRGSTIPANTSATTIDAIKTGVRFSNVGINMVGQGTIMFWYKSGAGWNGGQSAQLLDATQVNGQWFSLTKTVAGTLYFQVTDSTGTVWSVETTAQSFAAGAWVHVTVSWNFNALAAGNSDHLRIYINGGTPMTAAFTSNGTLSTLLDYVHFGDNPSGFTGSKGSVNSANGSVDELRLYNFEMNQAQVLGAGSQTHACSTFNIDHLELRHSAWSGIACTPGTMTVVACANAACSSLYTSGLVATLSASGAATIWDATTGGSTIVIGAGQSSATRNFYTAPGTAIFGITGTGVPTLELNPYKCNGAAGSCSWTSANDGLLIAVPNSGVVTGGKATAISVQGVHSSGPTPGAACMPIAGLTGAGLKIWSSSVNPLNYAGTSTSNGMTVGGAPQVANAFAGSFIYTPSSLPASNNVTGLDFDSNGMTTIWLKHMDTGQFNLAATLNVPATSSIPALTLSGSASVKSIPAGFGIAASAVTAPNSTQTSCASGASSGCDAIAGANARVASAGSIFSSKLTAALWVSATDNDLTDNPVAPSYAGSVVLTPMLMAPSGGSSGALSNSSVTLASGFINLNQSWTQSGAMRILASGTYLGNVITGQSAVLGRFSPHHLETVVTTQGCGSFTYSGQPITLVSIKAMDGASPAALTPNYKGAFARAVSLSDGNGSLAGSFTANVIAAASFSAGSAIAAPVFSFLNPKTAPITLALRASDGEVSSSGFSEGAAGIRSGRLRLQNAYGSEFLNLPVALEAQYWNGSSYSRNQLDNCSAVPASSITLANYQRNLSIGETQVEYASGTGGFSNGISRYLRLTKPGAGNNGSVDLSINLSAIPWFGVNPSSRATFGIYKTPVIYMRENF